MKTLCVVVVVVALSLNSVCQAASLGCTKLLEPVAEAPNITGTWYFTAISMRNCWETIAVGGIFQGVAMDVTATDNPNIYDMTVKVKLGSYCFTESETFLYENKTFFEVDANNTATGAPDELLQTGCSDCLVVKEMEGNDTLMLLSRRKQITSEEMVEFGEQSQCLGYSKPFIVKRNHDYRNCKPTDDVGEDDFAEHGEALYQLFENLESGLSKLLKEALLGDG